jgi:hypothetical protein
MRMAAAGETFHQAVLAKPLVHAEGKPNQQGSRYYAKADANPLSYARHVHHYEEDEHGEQPAREKEQVLGLQALELHAPSDAFVYRIIHDKPLLYV